MDVIAVGNEHASLAKEGLDKAEDGVESEGRYMLYVQTRIGE